MILDALTIFFIVAGLILLWLNVRSWRRRTVLTTLPEPERHLAGISDADIATSRARAQECLDEAAQATSETDKETWLLMAARWIALVEDAERHRGGLEGR
jgi:hypothetical protein